VVGEALFSTKDLNVYIAQRRRAELAQKDAHEREAKKALEEQIERLMTPIEITKERLANFMNRVRQVVARDGFRISDQAAPEVW
jgi:hypothetical protein